MRFLTTITPSGRAEYFAVALILNVILAFVTFAMFDLNVVFGSRTVTYNAAEAPLMAFVFAAYAAFIVINSMRRIKQLAMKSNTIAYLTPIPIIGQLVQIGLAFAEADNRSGYTPYGKNPYDPNSWVPPGKSSGKSGAAVAFQGEALMLPGEEQWDDAA